MEMATTFVRHLVNSSSYGEARPSKSHLMCDRNISISGFINAERKSSILFHKLLAELIDNSIEITRLALDKNETTKSNISI